MASDSDESSSGSSSEHLKNRKRSKKHKVKERKHKKSSKKSKHRRRHSSSSEEESSSSGEDQWVEAGAGSKSENTSSSSSKLKLKKKEKKGKPKSVEISTETSQEPVIPRDKEQEDDEWSAFGDILPTFTNDTKRGKKQKEREEMRQLSSIDRAGQSDKELNPYWKDGGKGLPSEQQEDKPKVMPAVGDGGLAWLKKSFQRAKQQASDEGRSLEEIVAERWGSLEKFYALLEDAEAKTKGDSLEGSSRHRRREDYDSRGRASKFKRPSRYSDDSEEDGRHSSRRNNREDQYSRGRSDRSDRGRDNNRGSERDREQSWRKPGSERKRTEPEPDSKSPAAPRTSSEVFENSSRPKLEPVKKIEEEEDMDEDVDEEEESPQPDTPSILTDQEMNALNAKIFKAELMGDSETVASLKLTLSEAQKIREEYLVNGKLPETKPKKVITKIIMGSQGKKRTKDKPTESHKDGQRIRYFPDDDRHSLKSMFEKEKMSTVEDENALFSRLMGKSSKATDEYDVDDIFMDKASSSRQADKDQKREIKNVLYEEKAMNKVLDDCHWCFDGKYLQKNLIASIGQTCFLCVPPYQSLVEGHCLIVPMSHTSCTTQLDEDVWTEMQKFRKALVRMFFQSEEDVVFFERAVFLKKQPHMYLECVPMPKETGELAPIYFKKAIQECETEWSQNKKVVDLKAGDVRKAVPKGLPYFSVEFGDDSCGFAHVIEEEKYFPANFAQEIIGGMLELDHQIWRKQKKDDFHTQRSKLMKFLKMWTPFDFTREEDKGKSS